MLEQLIHNGVVVTELPEPRGLILWIRGNPVTLTARQEEMALAFAKKDGTPYVEDPVFVANFMTDFSAALGLEESLSIDEIDFGPAIRIVEEEREAKKRLTKEERKELAAERKARREALREVYAYAIVNGERVELANYVVEPSSIFMGRGQHPLRGRWKEGARQRDVTLNLSPDAPRPEGDWGEFVWEPECMWVARWRDKLSGKLKYVWLHDSAPIKQEREAQKFDQVFELHEHLEAVRSRIENDLLAEDPKRRMIATACYLIDFLCLRVGDEKDADEADTVGATTLRPEHVTLHEDRTVEFRFLGKDSVLWHKKLTLPQSVFQNLEELLENARPSSSNQGSNNGHPTRDLPQIFPAISSRNVNEYLSEILDGLTAKVFRTHHATIAVRDSLTESGVQASDPEYKKWKAASLANLEAAILCNHTKQESTTWPRSRDRYKQRIAKAEERVATYRQRLQEYRQALRSLRQEAKEKIEAATTEARKEKARTRYEKRTERAKQRVEKAKERVRKARQSLGKIRAQFTIARKKRTWNLGTSLKSYIDPRVYYEWGQKIEYDVLERYYPKALRGKFSWARDGLPGEAGEEPEQPTAGPVQSQLDEE
jgi:DNA topoisomerase-1